MVPNGHRRAALFHKIIKNVNRNKVKRVKEKICYRQLPVWPSSWQNNIWEIAVTTR